MYDAIDEFVRIARAAGRDTRAHALRAALLAPRILRAHGCTMSDAAIDAILDKDFELNAAGLAAWLNRGGEPMTQYYLLLKSLHILSVVLFLGNIITGVFWKVHADRSGDLRARAQALDGIIQSDRWFTLPGVLAIIVTGVLLAMTWQLSDTRHPLDPLVARSCSAFPASPSSSSSRPCRRSCWPSRAPARPATGMRASTTGCRGTGSSGDWWRPGAAAHWCSW